MWIYVPSTCCPSVPASADSTSASNSRARMLERSATSRGKPTAARYWLKGWRTVAWTTRLFGRIYRPSTARRGVGSWIASLAESRANPHPSPGRGGATKIGGGSGRTRHESSAKSGRPSSSGRMFPDSYLATYSKPSATASSGRWREWVIALRADSSRRRKSARLTRGSGSSLWPTARTKDGLSTDQPRSRRGVVPTPFLSAASLEVMTTLWPTARVADGMTSHHALPCARAVRKALEERGRKEAHRLEDAVALWATPTVRDYRDGTQPSEKAATKGLLGRETPRAMDSMSRPTLPARRTSKAGSESSPPDRTSPPPSPAKRRRLSPAFVEWLMGLPPEWTVCGHSATRSYRRWRRVRGVP